MNEQAKWVAAFDSYASVRSVDDASATVDHADQQMYRDQLRRTGLGQMNPSDRSSMSEQYDARMRALYMDAADDDIDGSLNGDPFDDSILNTDFIGAS